MQLVGRFRCNCHSFRGELFLLFFKTVLNRSVVAVQFCIAVFRPPVVQRNFPFNAHSTSMANLSRFSDDYTLVNFSSSGADQNSPKKGSSNKDDKGQDEKDKGGNGKDKKLNPAPRDSGKKK